jgi:hypothetical protein
MLAQYVNGNTTVTLFADGTKIREFDSVSIVDVPESIDIKITNHCEPTVGNPICAYCHEKSGVNNQHADLTTLLNIIKPLANGKEAAIGGGNPLSHPQLIPFLKALKAQGTIANMTVNQKHLADYKDLILYLLDESLIKGIGISYSDVKYIPDIVPILKATDNLVFHMIMGINKVCEVDFLNNFCSEYNKHCKILVLGYKQYGYGINYYVRNSGVEINKYKWYTQLATRFRQNNLTLSFDNLAIQQLDLKRYFTDEAWNKFFQGEDGTHTMYIDAVRQEYAKSSTNPNRVGFAEMDLINFFQTLRGTYNV